jgi:membrane protein
MWRYKRLSARELRAEARGKFNFLVGTFYRAITRFRTEKIQFQANALAYRTLLNLVPMLAFLISFFALFKQLSDSELQSKMEATITKLMPYGSSAAQMIMGWVMSFVKFAKAGSYLGFFIMLLTSVFLFMAIDEALNLAFKVQKRRTFFQRLVLFTAILVWGPLLVGVSVYLTATVQLQPLLARLGASYIPIEDVFNSMLLFAEYMGTYFLSFFLIFLSLFFLFKVFPNTYVENGAAAFGAFFAAFSWEVTKWGFSISAARMLHTRQTIFATFAIFLVFLVWMYVTWVLVLFGAVLAYIYQHYRYELKTVPFKPRPVNKLWLSFQIMLELGVKFLRGEEPSSLKEMAENFCVGLPELSLVLKLMEDSHLVTRVMRDNKRMGEEQYQPARELDQIYLSQLVAAMDPDWKLEHTECITSKDPKTIAENQFLLKLFQNLKSEFDQYLSQRSLKEVLLKEILVPEPEPKPKPVV